MKNSVQPSWPWLCDLVALNEDDVIKFSVITKNDTTMIKMEHQPAMISCSEDLSRSFIDLFYQFIVP